MAAATAERHTPFLGAPVTHPVKLDVKTGETIYKGTLVGHDSNGDLVAATQATGEGPYYIADETITSAAAGSTMRVLEGTPGLVNGESATKAHIGDTVYVEDNQTIYRTSTGRSAAGTLKFIGADGYLYVKLNGTV